MARLKQNYFPNTSFETRKFMADVGICPYRIHPSQSKWNVRNYLIRIEKPDYVNE